MKRLLFLPVDERFCTRDYFILMAQAAGLQVVTPDKAMLGRKKTCPDMAVLNEWLRTEPREGDTLIASIDMAVHGGLIPSRLSLESFRTLTDRLAVFEELKKRGVRTYGSVCVTRAPAYDSAEEEPDYWQWYGKRLFDLSRGLVRFRNGSLPAGVMRAMFKSLPRWIVDDFLRRRRRNYRLVSRCIDLVSHGTIDFLNLVMDDNSEGSLSLWEAVRHGRKAAALGVAGRVSIHSGADESTLTLLAKTLCDSAGLKPRFKVEYGVPDAKSLVPAYEGLPLDEGVRSHIEAAGGEVVEGDEDILLLVHNPVERKEVFDQAGAALNPALIARILDRLSGYRGVAGIAGVRYANGSDNELLDGLVSRNFDWSRFNYAGWNTAGNTIGTVCAFSVLQLLAARRRISADLEGFKRLQAIFFMEHWAFQSNARISLIEAARAKGFEPWSVLPIEDWAVRFTKEAMEPYTERIRAATGYPKKGFTLSFPWHRSFEAGIEFAD